MTLIDINKKISMVAKVWADQVFMKISLNRLDSEIYTKLKMYIAVVHPEFRLDTDAEYQTAWKLLPSIVQKMYADDLKQLV